MASMAINPPLPALGAAGMSDVPVTSPGQQGQNASAQGAKMVFRVVESLKGIASAFPSVASDVDQLVSQVEKLGLTLMSQGSQGQAPGGGGFAPPASHGSPF